MDSNWGRRVSEGPPIRCRLCCSPDPHFRNAARNQYQYYYWLLVICAVCTLCYVISIPQSPLIRGNKDWVLIGTTQDEDPDRFTGHHYWVWYHYNSSSSSTINNASLTSSNHHRTRVLIAQASGPGTYLQLLDATQKVNRAYARKFGYDYAALLGLPMGATEGWMATFSKVQILYEVLNHHPEYDALLNMDADALLVDFDYDLENLLVWPDARQYAVIGQRVGAEDLHTWNMNAGVTFWNMKHPDTRFIATCWYMGAYTSIRIMPPRIGKHVSDQKWLQGILHYGFQPRQREQAVFTPNDIFRYAQGTVVKHIVRAESKIWKDVVDERLNMVQELVSRTCKKYEPSCTNISDTIKG